MHDTHRPDSVRRRPTGHHPSPLRRARRLPSRRRDRGFSIVELAVSLGIFLLISTLITIGVARSLSTASAVRTDRVVQDLLANQLASLSTVDYGSLIRGDFTVPAPCDSASPQPGLAEHTCLGDTPVGAVEVAYTYSQVGAGGVTDKRCATADTSVAENTNDDYGFVGLCAEVVSVGGVPVDLAGLAAGSEASSAQVNAPTPGYTLDQATVRVQLSGDQADLSRLIGDRYPLFVLPLDPANGPVAGSAIVDDEVVHISVDPQACDTGCVLGLDPTSSTPTINGDIAIGASHAAGDAAADGDPVTDASATVTTRVGVAGFTVAAGVTTDVTTRVFSTGRAVVDLVAADGSTTATPTQPGSVCLWVRFTDGARERVEPVCNAPAANRITLDTWTGDDGNDYPFPVGAPLELLLDHPSGACLPTGGTVPTAAGWVAGDQCTGFTWGAPSSGLGELVLTGGTTTSHTVRWTSTAASAPAVPAAGRAGARTLWATPRLSLACSTNASCSSVPDDRLEQVHCPDELCYSGAGSEPRVVTPASGVYATTDRTQTHPVTITDPEGDPVTATIVSGTSSGLLIGGTAATVGRVLASGAPGPVNLTVGYADSTSTATLTLRLRLSDGRSPNLERDVTVTFVRGTTWLQMVADDAVGIQGGTANVRVKVTDHLGAAASGRSITVSVNSTSVSGTATTNAAGEAIVALPVGSLTAGQHTMSVTAASAGTVTATLTVQPAAGTLGVSTTATDQGASSTATVTVADRAGNPMNNVAVSVSVTAPDGAATSKVTTSPNSCVTASGACTVTLSVRGDAPAGTYQVTARSGAANATVPFTVRPVPATLTTPDGAAPRVARGETSNPVTLVLRDRAGDPMPTRTVSFSGPTGFTWPATSPQTDTTGTLSTTVGVAGTVTVGDHTATATVSGTTLQVPVTVASSLLSVYAAPLTVPQGGTGTLSVTVTTVSGGSVAGTAAVASTDSPSALRLTAGSAYTVASDNTVTVPLEAVSTLSAGTHPVHLDIDGSRYTVEVTVSQVAAALNAGSAAIGQGKAAQPLVMRVVDARGAGVPGATVTLDPATLPGRVTVASATATSTSSGYVSFSVTDDPDDATPALGYTVSAQVSHPVAGGGTNTFTEQVFLTVTPTVDASRLALDPATVTLTAGGSGYTSVELVDLRGAPIVGHDLATANLPGGVSVAGEAGENLDRFEFDAADAGRYTSTLTGTVVSGDDSTRDHYTRGTGAHLRATGPTQRVAAASPTTADTRVHRVTARVRVPAGAAGATLAVDAVDAGGAVLGQVTLRTVTTLTPGEWVTVSGYVTGPDADGTAGGNAATPFTPAKLPLGAVAFTWHVTVAASDGTTPVTSEIDFVDVDAVDPSDRTAGASSDERGVAGVLLAATPEAASVTGHQAQVRVPGAVAGTVVQTLTLAVTSTSA